MRPIKNSELEPLRRAFAAEPPDVEESQDCPDPEQIWAAVHSELRGEETRKLIDHTTTCAACAEAWRLAREVGHQTATESAEAEQPTDGPRVLSMAHRFRRIAVPVASLAAAAILVLMVVPPGDGPVPPEFRAGETVGITSLLPADEALRRDQCLLVWTEVDGARYSVVVSDAELAVVAEAQDLENPHFEIPVESLARLAAGSELYWRVEAVLPDGTSRSSRTFVHHIE